MNIGMFITTHLMVATNPHILRCRPTKTVFMYRSQTFHRTWNILSSSYMQGTLVHGTHYACAIGNLIHHKKLTRLRKQIGLSNLLPVLRGDLGNADPYAASTVRNELHDDWFNELYYNGSCRPMIRGYSINELKTIDSAFISFNDRNDRDGFLGLNAVFNALCKIHNARRSKKRAALKKG